MHNARHRCFGVKAVEVDEGEDRLGTNDDGEVAPQLLERCGIDAGLAPGERDEGLIDQSA